MTRNSLNALLELLPRSPSINSKHSSFNDIFRSSRLGTLYNLSKKDQSYYGRHQQPHPEHQVISSYNAAHRRGEWGLKRPLPLVRDSHIVINQLDTEERQTPFYFAADKPKFVKRIQEMSIVLEPWDKTPTREQERLREIVSRRPRSLLRDGHPQWNRSNVDESGLRLITLSANKLRAYFDTINNKLNRKRFKEAQLESGKLEPGIWDESSDSFTQLVQSYLDISLDAPPFQTHPTAGLTYASKGFHPSPSARSNDYQTWFGAPRLGRCQGLKKPGNEGEAVLVHGIAARVKRGSPLIYDRKERVRVKVESAQINPFGQLEVTVSTPWPTSQSNDK